MRRQRSAVSSVGSEKLIVLVFILIVTCVEAATCVVINALANKSGIQSEPSPSYYSHYPSVERDNI
jgi:hypothetical protein